MEKITPRQLALWCLPALLAGAVLRLMLLSYAPYAYWEPDSSTYFGFAHKLFYESQFAIDSKRRYLYPVLVWLTALLPGSPMRWIAWAQHLLGLGTVFAVGYIVRKTLVTWRWVIIPATVAFATIPIVIWYEHAALGESIFLLSLIWSVAGWTAWWKSDPPAEGERDKRWWWFFVPFAISMITRSAGRFFWPGIVVGILICGAPRRFRRIQIISLVALFFVSLTAGSTSQGSWLLYSSVFPLTRLDSPKFADYKAEIRDLVVERRGRLDRYYAEDDDVKNFLDKPRILEDRPLWKELGSSKMRKPRLRMYRSLALEAMAHNPHLLLYIGAQRMIASANTAQFKERRFTADYAGERIRDSFSEGTTLDDNMLRLILGISRDESVPPMDAIAGIMSPNPDAPVARAFLNFTAWHDRAALFFTPADAFDSKEPISKVRPTFLCIWVLLGLALSFSHPYRATLGVWTLVIGSYLCGTYMVGSANPRFFIMWPLFCAYLGVPIDAIVRLLIGRRAQKDPAAAS